MEHVRIIPSDIEHYGIIQNKRIYQNKLMFNILSERDRISYDVEGGVGDALRVAWATHKKFIRDGDHLKFYVRWIIAYGPKVIYIC